MADARIETIRELCSFERRLAGTDAERRAANRLAERLRDRGRRADIEPTYVHPQAPLVWAAHCALAVAGSVLAVAEPAAGFALVLATAASLYFDLNAGPYLLRRLFFRRASQNVVSPGDQPDAPARLLIVAHYDAGRSGLAFAPRQLAWAQRLQRILGFQPTRLLFWSMAILLPMLGARMASVSSDGVAAAQLLPTLLLLVAIYLLLDMRFSGIAPGANDNASGVAVALSLAERLQAAPPAHLDVWLVLTGAQECGTEGMRAFVRARRKLFDPASTFVVAIDSVGAGDVRWIAAEGVTISFPSDPRLLELCEAVAEARRDAEPGHPSAAVRSGFASDALPARARGWRATTVTCLEAGRSRPANTHTVEDLPEAIDPAALDRAEEFVLALVHALDREADRTRTDASV